jgi:hypothetical protein
MIAIHELEARDHPRNTNLVVFFLDKYSRDLKVS